MSTGRSSFLPTADSRFFLYFSHFSLARIIFWGRRPIFKRGKVLFIFPRKASSFPPVMSPPKIWTHATPASAWPCARCSLGEKRWHRTPRAEKIFAKRCLKKVFLLSNLLIEIEKFRVLFPGIPAKKGRPKSPVFCLFSLKCTVFVFVLPTDENKKTFCLLFQTAWRPPERRSESGKTKKNLPGRSAEVKGKVEVGVPSFSKALAKLQIFSCCFSPFSDLQGWTLDFNLLSIIFFGVKLFFIWDLEKWFLQSIIFNGKDFFGVDSREKKWFLQLILLGEKNFQKLRGETVTAEVRPNQVRLLCINDSSGGERELHRALMPTVCG